MLFAGCCPSFVSYFIPLSYLFTAGKEMWPVHSELIEMGLHVHPVLLTLASTLKDGVVSMEDGLLAKVMIQCIFPTHRLPHFLI